MRTKEDLKQTLDEIAQEVGSARPLGRRQVRRVWGHRIGAVAAVLAVLGAGTMFASRAIDRTPDELRPAAPAADGASSGEIAGKTWTVEAERTADYLSIDLTVGKVQTGISSPLDPSEDLYRSVTTVSGIGDRLAIFGYAAERVTAVEVVLASGERKMLDFIEPNEKGLDGHLFVSFEPLREPRALVASTVDGSDIRDEIDYRAIDPSSTPEGELVASGKVRGAYWEVRTFTRYDYTCAVSSLAPEGMGAGTEVCAYPDPIYVEEYYVPEGDFVLFLGTAPDDVERIEVAYSDGRRMPLQTGPSSTPQQAVVYGTSTSTAADGEIIAYDATGDVVYRAALDTRECRESLPDFSGTCS